MVVNVNVPIFLLPILENYRILFLVFETFGSLQKIKQSVYREGNPKGNANRLIRLAVRKCQNLRLLSDSYNS